MDLKDAKSLTDTQVSRKLEEIRAGVPTQKLPDVVDWVTKVSESHPKLFVEVASTLDKISEQTVNIDVLKDILVFFRNNLERLEKACAEHFFFVSLITQAQEDETLSSLASEILETVREAALKNDDTSQVMPSLLKTRIVPKLKEMAEAKMYTKSFAVWRAIVRTTKLKITNSTVNDVLLIATMAFKENNPEFHALAFKSWKILIENLPPDVLRKPAYIRLVLNPLNRTYRDTDANSTLQKYIAWWQHVVALGEDAESNFDEIVVPLLQKVFCMPSAKARQVNPTAFANPTRTIPYCAYTILALLWYDGNADLRSELNQLAHPNFKVNEHLMKVSCLAKHFGVFEEAFSLVVNNISQKVCVPPKDYPFLICRVLLSRVSAFYENEHHDMVRLILSTAYSILQTMSDVDHTLKIFQDLSESLPARVMSSPQFNFRKGTFSMHECPVMTLTSFYIRHVAEICHSKGGENNRKKFRKGFKTLLERGSKHINPLRFTVHVMTTLQTAETLKAESWQELTEFLISAIERTVDDGENPGGDMTAIIDTLAFPISGAFPLTTNMAKSWIELLTAFMKTKVGSAESARLRVADICDAAHKQLKDSTYDLNHLLLISQMMEYVVKHCDLHSPQKQTQQLQRLGHLEPFVNCLVDLIRKGCEQLTQEKQPKAACQFYVNVVEMVHTLLRDVKSPELCRELTMRLVPELGPIFENTTNKTKWRTSPLYHVENALLLALDHVLYALKKKSNEFPKDKRFLDVIRDVVEKLTNHWKSSIHETTLELAKAFSIVVEKRTQSKRSSSGLADTQVSTAQKAAVETTRDTESPPTRKWTRSTPDASFLKNGKSRGQGTPTAALTTKRKSKTGADEEEFTPITTTKKKSEIFTEHQLEKLKEPKIIPSMYEDLSRSSQGTLMGPPSKPPEVAKASTQAVDVSSSPTAFNGSSNGNGKPSTRESMRRSSNTLRKNSPRKLREHPGSEEDLKVFSDGNSNDESRESRIPVKTNATEDQNRENQEPKNISSDSGTSTSSPENSSQRVPHTGHSNDQASESDDKPRGAQKRKLGKPSFSPISKKLRPKRLSTSLSKTRTSRSDPKLLNDDQSQDSECTTAGGDTKHDRKVGSSKSEPLESIESPTEDNLKRAEDPKSPLPTDSGTAWISSIAKQDHQHKPSDIPSSSGLGKPAESSRQSLVDLIRSATGVQREEVLRFISSPGFLQAMSTEERKSFLSAFFKNVSDYIL